MTRMGAALLPLALLVVAPAQAADAIRPGKWEYTVTTQMPNMPQLPPGVQLPPNVHIQQGPGGMAVTHTSCVTAADPTAELSRPHGPNAAQSQCKVERMDRNGGTVSWVTTCTTPDATVHSEGTARYSGDRMDASFRSRTTPRRGGQPMEASNTVTGRYLGPCDR